MKEKEREANAMVTVNMTELKEMIDNLPGNTILSVTMEEVTDVGKEGE